MQITFKVHENHSRRVDAAFILPSRDPRTLQRGQSSKPGQSDADKIYDIIAAYGNAYYIGPLTIRS